MPNIYPFRAFRFNLNNSNLQKAVCPPYDVIDEVLAKKLRKNNSNAVHIELPAGSNDEKYANARKTWEVWKSKGLVQQDVQAAFYVLEQIFKVNGKRYARKGFFCELEVENPGEGSVLRHELTLAGPKQDRLNLLRTLRLNTSPIFGLFKDSQKKVKRVFDHVSKNVPDNVFKDADGVMHRLWLCKNASDIRTIQNNIASVPVAIADGHHRYETAWNYWQEAKDTASHSTLFYLCPMDDSGLVIFPTHRIVKKGVSLTLEEMVRRIKSKKELFKLRAIPKAGIPKRSSFIMTNGRKSYEVKALPCVKKLFSGKPKEYLELALAHLHSVLLTDMKKEDFLYSHDLKETLRLMKQNKTFAILVPPTSTEELYGIVEAGALMPQKSTYFYPKVTTGLVFRSLSDS